MKIGDVRKMRDWGNEAYRPYVSVVFDTPKRKPKPKLVQKR